MGSLNFTQILFNNSVPTSQKITCISITMVLMASGKIHAVYSEKHMKYINIWYIYPYY
jgi:hypothetical protein